MKSMTWRVLQVVAVAAIIFFLYRYVAANWEQIRQAPDAIHVHAGSLAAAAAIILATYAMLIAAWRAVLTGWGEQLAYRDAARIWCLSNLAKYLPGRVWQIAGMAALAQQAGVSPWAAAGSAIVVQLLNIATGALITVIFAPSFGHPLLIGLAGCGTALAAAALASARGAALLSRAVSKVAGRSIELRAVKPLPLLLSAAITAAQWVAYGLALYYCVHGLTGRDIDVGTGIGVFTGAYVAGLVNILTPAGVGTREVILVNWLAGPLGQAGATVVTVGSRLLMTATELIAALVTLPFKPTQPRADVRKA